LQKREVFSGSFCKHTSFRLTTRIVSNNSHLHMKAHRHHSNNAPDKQGTAPSIPSGIGW